MEENKGGKIAKGYCPWRLGAAPYTLRIRNSTQTLMLSPLV